MHQDFIYISQADSLPIKKAEHNSIINEKSTSLYKCPLEVPREFCLIGVRTDVMTISSSDN